MYQQEAHAPVTRENQVQHFSNGNEQCTDREHCTYQLLRGDTFEEVDYCLEVLNEVLPMLNAMHADNK